MLGRMTDETSLFSMQVVNRWAKPCDDKVTVLIGRVPVSAVRSFPISAMIDRRHDL